MGIVAAAQAWSGGYTGPTGDGPCRRAARRTRQLPRMTDGPVQFDGRRRCVPAEVVGVGHVGCTKAGRPSWRPVGNGALVLCSARSRAVVPGRPGGRRFAIAPDGERHHWTAAAGTGVRRRCCVRDGLGTKGALRRRGGEQLSAQREPGGTVTIGEKAVMTDTMEAVRQGVEEEDPMTREGWRPTLWQSEVAG
jgi:hypothetical protein